MGLIFVFAGVVTPAFADLLRVRHNYIIDGLETTRD